MSKWKHEGNEIAFFCFYLNSVRADAWGVQWRASWGINYDRILFSKRDTFMDETLDAERYGIFNIWAI